MKRLLVLLAFTFGIAAQADAGSIGRFRIACKGAANTYGIEWWGSWSTYPIYLERRASGSSNWVFEAGEFDFSPGNTGSKVPNNHFYRMNVQTEDVRAPQIAHAMGHEAVREEYVFNMLGHDAPFLGG